MNEKNLSLSALIPEPDKMTIAVRAFVPSPKGTDESSKPKNGRRGPSEWTFVFDTETTVDAQQNLRIGAYQLRNGDKLDESGLFYDPEILTDDEQKLVIAYAERVGSKLYVRQDFVDDVLFGKAYEFRALIVGFNLPFDLSRLAIHSGPAHSTKDNKTMRGGFTFKLSSKWWWPNVQVKYLSSRMALMQFTAQPRRPDTRFERKRKQTRITRRGALLDVKTLAAALLSGSFSLASLTEFLETKTRKHSSDEHGGQLTEDYIGYCINDVQATWECYRILRDKFDRHGLEDAYANQILSEASLGKKYLGGMGIWPFLKLQPDFPHVLTGQTLSAYFGGRSEVHCRREITQVFYCDFLSMYPTVFILMGLWKFVIAQGVTWKDTTTATKDFVERLTTAELQTPATWKQLSTLVRIKPQADILPVRAKYDGRSQTIGLNYLSSKPSSDQSLWYTLADVVVSKLLTGKSPEIDEAITFTPQKPQSDLKKIAIAGNPEYLIDPEHDDFFKRIIDLRSTVKGKLKKAKGTERKKLDAEQLALKILANATSYGIFVEVNVNKLNKSETRECFGSAEASFPIETVKDEEPGKYFHPLLAALITGAARLMLATAERLIQDRGLDWAFCDTDSMAIAKPNEMDQDQFIAKAKSVCSWYEPLNPYEQKGSLFKIEDANYGIFQTEDKELQPLYSLCISSKRYVLFNLVDGQPVIRKASAHGLGHYLPPYGQADAPATIPAPSVPLSEIGVERWQYDLWSKIIQATLEGHPEEVDLSYHPALNHPAASRYGATTPDLLRWFKGFNKDKPYAEQVKAFNFMVAFQARSNSLSTDEDVCERHRKGRKPKQASPKPIAPFDKDIGKASQNAFDRETGKSVSRGDLKTYREALAQFHLCPESKFLNGDFVDRGHTERRHIQIDRISYIGKEANKWEEQYFLGLDQDAQVEYGTYAGGVSLDVRLRKLCIEIGERKASTLLTVPRMTLRKALLRGCHFLRLGVRLRIEARISPVTPD